ncbi:MAG: hypothetical protein ABUS56_01945 [Acidobacteriota bacterium]
MRTTSVPRATYEDVNLVLKLYDMRREPRMREARRWFVASFKVKALADVAILCPPGSEENASYRQVTTYYEMVASFLTSAVLNPGLYYQSGREMLVVWERIRDIVPEIRAANRNPLEFHNLEQAAAGFIEWWNETAPGAYQAFSARVRG